MLGRAVTYHSREVFDALSEQDKFEYVKEGVLREIDQYIDDNSAKETFYSKISFRDVNSFRATVTGEEGKDRAITFRDYISKITALDSLLQVLRDNLKEALKKNAHKTITGIPLEVASNMVSVFFKRNPGPKDLLGNSTNLANRVASTLVDMFNSDRDQRALLREVVADAGGVHPELAASIYFLSVEMKAMEARMRNTASASAALVVSSSSNVLGSESSEPQSLRLSK